MKISDHIKNSLDACSAKDTNLAMLFVCLAVDGTAKKMYPEIEWVAPRFKRFINDHIDIIELMVGGINLKETKFPFADAKGNVGMTFADIVFEKIRCNLAHGNELPTGYGVFVQPSEGVQQFLIDLEKQAIYLPESTIYALGLVCVLASVNADQSIGNNAYYYRDPINSYVVDRWWGKLDCARKIMDFDSTIKITMEFSEQPPKDNMGESMRTDLPK